MILLPPFMTSGVTPFDAATGDEDGLPGRPASARTTGDEDGLPGPPATARTTGDEDDLQGLPARTTGDEDRRRR